LGVRPGRRAWCTPRSRPIVAYPDARRFQVAEAWLWAAFWTMVAMRPLVADQAHRRRAEWSLWYREHPTARPAPAPEPSPKGEPATLGWALRTMPLALVFVGSMTVTIAGVSELLVGQYGRQGLPWLLASLVVDGLVLWAFRRQYRRRRA
jgi:hypothetical protein